jgi:hypothetical protein
VAYACQTASFLPLFFLLSGNDGASGSIRGRLDSRGCVPLRPTTFAVQGTDYKLHLVYELVITNTGNAAATIEKIEVVSGNASAKVFASFDGDALPARLRATGRGDEAASPIESSGSRLFLLDFTMDKDSHPPTTLLHRFHLVAAGPPGSPKDSVLVSNGDHVQRGQVFALLGDTGNTSALHLHFHLMDGTSVLGFLRVALCHRSLRGSRAASSRAV